MSNEELQQLKALALAATPGPWSECGNARGGCSCGQVWSTSADMPVATVDRGDEEIGPIAPEVYKANAKYIAAANPAAILALIERIESLAANAERYQWLLNNYALGDGYHDIDAALNDGEADKYLSPAIDVAMEREKAK